MDNFLLSLNAVLPMFIPMTLGYIYRRWKSTSDSTILQANGFVFNIFLPFLLFSNIYGSTINFAASVGLLLFLLAFLFVEFMLLLLIAPKYIKDLPQRGVFIQGVVRPNSALYGLPIATALLQPGDLPIIALVLAVIVIPFNVFSVVALEVNRANRPSAAHIAGQILHNPIIIGITLALLLNAAPFRLPDQLRTYITQIGNVATPLAFFLLGASFTFSAAAKNKKILSVIAVLRLIVTPACYLLPAILLGFRGAELVATLIASAPPTAVSSYPMAVALGGDGELASETVVFTSAFSIVTMFCWIYLLKALGLLN